MRCIVNNILNYEQSVDICIVHPIKLNKSLTVNLKLCQLIGVMRVGSYYLKYDRIVFEDGLPSFIAKLVAYSQDI